MAGLKIQTFHGNRHTNDTLSPGQYQKDELIHVLCRGWRAQQWQEFLGGSSRAAAALGCFKLSGPRQWARVAMQESIAHARNHLQAVYCNRWVSDARAPGFERINKRRPYLLFLRNQFCHCATLAAEGQNQCSDSLLFQWLGWPSTLGRSN